MSVPILCVGQRLGSYQIIDEIGRGGMAVVYKAYDSHHRRYVALKVLPAYFQHDQQLVERFHREARAARGLDHPNIVQVYGSGEADGLHYLAMEYAGGGSLSDLLAQQQGPLELGRAVDIAAQVGAALEYSHGRGLIHRDLKPSNILLAAEGRVLLCDFGIAKVLGQSTLTGTGQVMGTPAYMAPEQARGQRDLDGRADIYALGVILYQMLTGRVPFDGDTPLVVLRAVVDDPVPRPTTLNGGIPPGVEGVILRAMEKERARRFQRVGELVAALRAVMYHLQARERPSEPPTISRLPRSSQPRASDEVSPPPAGDAGRSGLPSWLLPLAAGLVALTVVVLIFTVAFRPPQPAMPTVTPTLSPTPTRAQPTSTSKPTATPALYPAPVLDEPADGAVVESETFELKWHWDGTLGEGGHFDVRIWRGEQEHRGIAWTDLPFYQLVLANLPPELKGENSEGEYRWAIAVVEEPANEGEPVKDLSIESASRTFIWKAGGGSDHCGNCYPCEEKCPARGDPDDLPSCCSACCP
jgi:serine/threonine-protein kinase